MRPTVTAVGRFAPTPSGALHFGSLIAATASYLQARQHGGRWLLRIDDVDTPRVVPGSAHDIITTLAHFGFEWDGEIVWQSRRYDAYQAAFEQLRAAGMVYPCACTRRELASAELSRDGTRRYPGTCRQGMAAGGMLRAWRLRTDHEPGFEDLIQGWQQDCGTARVGDFVLLRADGVFAYHLATVVDDADAGVTEVVRGADLLDSTLRQLHLQQLLGLPQPLYAHLPVAVNAAAEKLSKQTRAQAIARLPTAAALFACLRFLGQAPPPDLAAAPLAELWQWAQAHWSLAQVPRCASLDASPFLQLKELS
ncbi:MAG: tRNA glutamyl-Q(34) synthetase GluQRS [Thauera sp.]|jgi:glutamyl-Q tRNA(Asp) synthetase|nr:tRNA glutamyl-Q(34) synthetase GluQRS [Thauera sp.]